MLTSLDAPAQAPTLPFRCGSTDDFRELREMLVRHGYREPHVQARLAALEAAEARGGGDARHGDALAVLVDLFHGVSVPACTVHACLEGGDLAVLERLGLIDDQEPERVRGTVLLYPTQSLYIISDVNHDGEGDAAPPPDVVYPAITSNTAHFLALLPDTPCERLLELCAGTGIAALAGARHAARAWAVDITERATRFAQFNAQLNGIDNVTIARGDLYAAVRGLTFDRIVAHPPHVPSPRREYIFRDGGEDGEEVTRRIIAGLPDHLEPGGRAYLACMMSDRRGAPLEERVRVMLGERAGEFDVVVLQRWAMHPSEYHARAAFAGRLPSDEARARTLGLGALGVEQLVYGMVVLQRRAVVRPVFTTRLQLAAETRAVVVEWLLRWRTAAEEPDFERRLLDATPFATPGAEAHVVHRAGATGWEAESCRVGVRYPFVGAVDGPPWLPELMARCDERLTVREHLRALCASGTVSDAAGRDGIIALIRELLDRGVLQLESCSIPEPPSAD